MDYCTTHFGKKLSELSYEDIETYFQKENTETDQLEFKSINPNGSLDDKLKGIQKTVCAFLNSGGGLLIWGAPEGVQTAGKKEKIFTGALTPYLAVLEKDYLVNIVSDAILPLPAGIRINPIVKEGKTIVIIEVDSSDYSPHQTDNIFYMRMDGQSRPAPHHYIEALFKKIKYPNIEILLKLENATEETIEDKDYWVIAVRIGVYNWSPLQNEEDLYYRIGTNGIFEEYLFDDETEDYRNDGHEYKFENIKRVLYYGEPVTKRFRILFEPRMTRSRQSQIFIFFGGRYSPMKQSKFTIDFSKFPSDLKNLFVPKFENQLTKDIHDSLGRTKEEIIKSFVEM
jgi:hypothetical protein